jgi:hypothetical protein
MILVMKSKFLTLDWKDFSRGLLIAFLTAVLTGVINILDTRRSIHMGYN